MRAYAVLAGIVAASSCVAQVVNDECIGAIPIADGVHLVSNIGATGCCWPNSDIWFSYSNSTSCHRPVQIAGVAQYPPSSPFYMEPSFVVYRGSCAALVEVENSGAFPGVSFLAEPSTTYLIRTGDVGSLPAQGPFVLTITSQRSVFHTVAGACFTPSGAYVEIWSNSPPTNPILTLHFGTNITTVASPIPLYLVGSIGFTPGSVPLPGGCGLGPSIDPAFQPVILPIGPLGSFASLNFPMPSGLSPGCGLPPSFYIQLLAVASNGQFLNVVASNVLALDP